MTLPKGISHLLMSKDIRTNISKQQWNGWKLQMEGFQLLNTELKTIMASTSVAGRPELTTI
jgi:hypothetical protein